MGFLAHLGLLELRKAGKMVALAQVVEALLWLAQTAATEDSAAAGGVETHQAPGAMADSVAAAAPPAALPLVATVATAEAVALVLRAARVGQQLSASTTKEQLCTTHLLNPTL